MDNLSLVVGLGNPGDGYANTRHNAGFMVVDRLASAQRAEWKNTPRFKSRLARVTVADRPVLLCQPQTFMNLSGEAVGAVVGFYRIALGQVLVLVDDADLPLGTLRLRPQGSSGGHHGLESVEASLGSREYARLRLGIGRLEPAEREIRDYVLGRFKPAERKLLDNVLARAVDQVICWLTHGVEKAMNDFNGLVEASER